MARIDPWGPTQFLHFRPVGRGTGLSRIVLQRNHLEHSGGAVHNDYVE